jgi:glycine/D-amino acid oxidase-like deaminating enzyme
MKKRWPQINFSDVYWGIFEPECGYLDARASCQAVVDAFVAQGGAYRQAAVAADSLEDSPLHGLKLSDGSSLKADTYVFACGPWMGHLFPKTLGNIIRPTKQDIFFFGTPAGDARFTYEHLPVWGDHSDRFFYGIPGKDRRGFKVADDTCGGPFDPTDGERTVSLSTLKRVREYIAFRFPAMKNAPLIESRVCQYEQTVDSDFVLDRHPKMDNVWFLGGGSGHGFKHGPALGEIMANLVLNDAEPKRVWRLSRFPQD